jgi:hypothetical protein
MGGAWRVADLCGATRSNILIENKISVPTLTVAIVINGKNFEILLPKRRLVVLAEVVSVDDNPGGGKGFAKPDGCIEIGLAAQRVATKRYEGDSFLRQPVDET